MSWETMVFFVFCALLALIGFLFNTFLYVYHKDQSSEPRLLSAVLLLASALSILIVAWQGQVESLWRWFGVVSALLIIYTLYNLYETSKV
jgi:hypothetical protein